MIGQVKINRLKVNNGSDKVIDIINIYLQKNNWVSINKFFLKKNSNYIRIIQENEKIYLDFWNKGSFGIINSGYSKYWRVQLIVKELKKIVSNMQNYLYQNNISTEECFTYIRGIKLYFVDIILYVVSIGLGILLFYFFNYK